MRSLYLAILAFLGGAVITADGYCLEIYRADLMQLWSVKADSSLCSVDKNLNNTQITLVRQDGDLAVLSTNPRDANLTFDELWVTVERKDLNMFGIALIRPADYKPYFIWFLEDPEKAGEFNLLEPSEEFNRLSAAYYLKTGDIDRHGLSNKSINLLVLLIVILLVCGRGFWKLKFGYICTFLTVLTITTTTIQGSLYLHNPLMLIGSLVVSIGLSLASGWFVDAKLERSVQTKVATGCTAILVIFAMLACAWYAFFGSLLLLISLFHPKESPYAWLRYQLAQMHCTTFLACMALLVHTPAAFHILFRGGSHQYLLLGSDQSALRLGFYSTFYFLVTGYLLMLVRINKGLWIPASLIVAN